jgi:RNA polymerase sigma factor (sigma-70 family)
MAMGMRGAPQIGESVSGVGLGDDGERLAAAVARGDAEATRRLVEVVGSVILDAVRMVLGPNHADFEAVTERALMHLVEAMGTFGGQCSVSHFAGRVAVVAALASRRQTHDHRIAAADWERKHAAASPASPLSAEIEARRRRDTLRELLDELPEAIGEAMALRFMLGYSVDEIAAVTQIPLDSVWSRLRIGNERLRIKLDPLSKT